MNIVIRRLAFLTLLIPIVAAAQSQFILKVQQGTNVFQVPNGSTLTVSSPSPGTARTIQLLVTYIGNTSVTFPDGVTLAGSPDFSVSGGNPGSALGSNQTATIGVVYTPSSAAQALAQLEIGFLEAAPPPSTPDTPPLQPTRGRLILALVGGVPVYSLQYAVGSTGNTIAVPPDGQLAFPDTVTNSSSIAAVAVQNRGAGTGSITSVSLSGGAFALAALPALPSGLASAGIFPFQVVYLPRAAGSDTGTLRIVFDGGVIQTYQLSGRGISSQLSYELIGPGTDSRPLLPNQTIEFPKTTASQTSTLQVRFTNVSGSDFAVTTLGTTGGPFIISNLPFLPLTLAPGASGMASVSFTPTLPERVSGGLRIANDTFNLLGEGLGPRLAFSYRGLPSSTAIAVEPQGQVTAPSVTVGRSSTVEFTVQNLGNAAASLNTIGLASGGDVFKTSGLPPLPFVLQPQASVSFSLQFLPNNTGFATGSLRIDSASFAVSGLGDGAVPLSNYTINGPSQVGPLEQPAVTLTLGQPYPIPLTGTLNLLVASSYSVDPSVQFSTGSRTVTFTIPANSTRAVFPNASAEMRLQSGSVSSAFTIAPTFSTQGGLGLTPESPSVLQFSMPASPPRLLGVQVAERGVSTLTLRVLGLTTTRSLGKMDVHFTAAPGFNVTTLDFSLDLAGASAVWFNSTSSQAFGGQFSLDVQFQLATSDRGTGATPPTQALDSVNVTLTSPSGNSNTVTVGLR